MIDASVVSCWFRPGGLDVLMAGMRDQTYPRDRYEVILVDRRYERRHAEVMALAARYGVTNLRHVPEHRRNGPWAVVSSAFNTAFALARGTVILMLTDWTYAPPGWIEAHLRHHDGPPAYVLAPYPYHAVGITRALFDRLASELPGRISRPWAAYADQPKLRMKRDYDLSTQDDRQIHTCLDEDAVLRGEVFDEVSIFEEGLFDPAWLARMPPIPDDGDIRGCWTPAGAWTDPWGTHLKNESVLREVVWRLNGLDVWSERGGRVQIDSEFGLRLEALGVRFLWEPAAVAHTANPRHGICRTRPFGDDARRVAGRWSRADCDAYFERRIVEIRARKFLAAPAPYTLAGLADRLALWRTAAGIDTAPLDVPDRAFYGRDIWPFSPYG